MKPEIFAHRYRGSYKESVIVYILIKILHEVFVASPDWILQVNALFIRVQQQEQDAMKTFYEETSHRVYAILYRILKSSSDAEDALQEVYIKLWKQSHQYQGSGSAWGWLCVMARHVALDRLRQTQRVSFDTNQAIEDIVSQINESNQLDDRHWLGKCLCTLKPPIKEVLLLSYIEGYSHNEISQQVTKPLGTIKAWIRRSLGELKQCLEY